MKKWIIILAILFIAFLVYKYIYKEHRNIQNERSEFVLNAKTLVDEFQIDPTKAESKYLNKTITVSGSVSELNKKELTIDDKVFCLFNESITNIILNQNIKIKGRFIGYDDLLEQVKLDQCSITNN